MAEVSLTVKPRGKPIRKLPKEATLSTLKTTGDLYAYLAKPAGYSVHRLRITKEDGSVVANSSDTTLAGAGLADASTINVKDLGPQIGWRTVFIIEYLGPLLIHPAFFYLRPYIYPTPSLTPSDLPPASPLQQLTMVLCIIHFIKREFETIFVHRFSAATMPAFNIVKNSGHYWVLAGFLISYWTYSPTAPAQYITKLQGNDTLTQLGMAYFIIGELGNLYTHIVLSNLRPKGTTTRGVPQGFFFGLVTCPNYMFEALAWAGVSLVSRSWATLVFMLVSSAQMYAWAQKKEKRYRQDFGDKYKPKRYVFIPGIC